MKQTAMKLFEAMESELRVAEIDDGEPIKRALVCSGIVRRYLQQLKEVVYQTDFKDQDEEIHFFKTIAPGFYKHLIYYVRIYHLETKKPVGSDSDLRKHLEKELKRIRHHFNYNKSFYEYCRSGATFMDTQMFVRDINNPVFLSEYTEMLDPKFCTPYSYLFSEIEANELIKLYLLKKIRQFKQDFRTEFAEKEMLTAITWTAPKNYLIELIYGLHSAGSLNNGTADVKSITEVLERTFNVSLGNVYRAFQDIRIRSNRTLFLDQLKDRLKKRMDDTDENPRY